MTAHALTRRQMLTVFGGAAVAGLAGCIGNESDTAKTAATVYVVTYHWGYAAFDENGNELDLIEIEPNTELTLHAVNDHAYDAFEELPDPVATEFEDFDALARTKAKVEAGELPEPEDATVVEVYDKAHGHSNDDHGHDDHGHDDHGHDDHGHDDHGHDDHGHDDHGHDDHGHDDHGHDDHGHDGAKLDHGFMIPDLDVQIMVPWDTEELVTATTVVEEPGYYEAWCTVDCGYYHAHQQEELIHVTDQ